MHVLIDTNILVRGIHRKDPQHVVAIKAIRTLQNTGDTVCVVPQNLYELWCGQSQPDQRQVMDLVSRPSKHFAS